MAALLYDLESFTTLKLTDSLVGESVVMIELKRAAVSIPASQMTILISGQNGTGRESLGRYVHVNSARRRCPFVPVDCSSLSETQFENELFGYVKGAFEGATRASLGFIRAAAGGCLYLDEISELSLPLQSRLLQFLRDRLVLSAGDPLPHLVDARVIASTNRDLNELVRQGRFLEELCDALAACTLKTPALQDRPKDILPLAQHFLRIQGELYQEPVKKISEPVATVLQTYAWPGNVRELVNVLEQAHVLASGDTIELGDIPLRLQNAGPQPAPEPGSLSLDELEKQTIVTALKRCNYNRAAAGRMLGISMPRLKRRIARLGL